MKEPKKEELRKFEEVVGKKVETLEDEKVVKIIWDGKQFRIPLPKKMAESAGIKDGSQFRFILKITEDEKIFRGEFIEKESDSERK